MPHTIHRKPTDFGEITKWKSSEIKNFLFYQSTPIFIYILGKNRERVSYLYKYLSYVIAIRILYAPIKQLTDLEKAEEIISNYLLSLEEIFGIYAYTFTAHAHLHLSDQVRLHGPLQCHSQFFFEGALYNLKNLLHGTKGFIDQISKQIFLFKNLQGTFNDTNFNNNVLYEFIERKMHLKRNELETRLYGKLEKIKTNKLEEELLSKIYNLRCKIAVKSDRAFSKKRLFHSKSYNRKGNCNSYSVSYSEDENVFYGDIEYFLETSNKIFAFLNKHNLKKNPDTILPPSTGFFYNIVKNNIFNYYKVIEFSKDVHLINIECIRNRCIIIKIEEIILITELEYEFEHN
jgi:hypothetical protein